MTNKALPLLFAAAIAFGQDAGEKLYAEHCVACHGENAGGTDQGPRLAGSRTVRSRSVAQLRAFINQGSPSAGMPPFRLPGPELDALAAFVHSLNSPAAENPSPGSPEEGQAFFFGKGQCGE